MNAQLPLPAGSTSQKDSNLPLATEVQWADIGKIERGDADVLVVGQYMSVAPRGALGALDSRLSRESEDHGLLSDLIHRGALRCSVGDVHFFPNPRGPEILILGMGRQGLFTTSRLEKVARCGAEAIGRLIPKATISSVIVGTGADNLTVREAVTGLVTGYVDALAADPGLSPNRLRIVEIDLERALEILDILERLQNRRFKDRISVAPTLIDGPNGKTSVRFCYSTMLANVANAWGGTDKLLAKAIPSLLKGIEHERSQLDEAFAECTPNEDPRRAGLRFRISRVREGDPDAPDRVTFSQDGRQVRSAAMTNMATVTERILSMSYRWVDRIVEDLYAAVSLEDADDEDAGGPPDVATRARSAYGYLIHPDIREKIEAPGPLVLEVDRGLARIPWEMLQDAAVDRKPLAIERPLARQLRTVYSPRVGQPVARETLRALVIGDPDPDHPLPIARSEAVAVAKALSARRMEVHLCIGAPDANGRGTFSHPETSRFVAPADLFRIIARLQGGCYDLVHFAGHGTFSADTPELSGWLFAGNEVLTPAMLENTENAPALIFANACLSGALAHDPRDTSADAAGAERRRRWRGEAQLVASLADEFLRRGVADYIGTAWPVPDALASEFATTFYQTLLDSSEMTLGGAMQKARAQIHAKRDGNAHRESAWAAYQHYGDPTRRLNATGTGA